MNGQEYYGRVIDRLRNCYQFGHYVIAAGNELAAETHETIFPAIAATLDQLEKFTLERGLQVHLPIVGERSRSVLMPLDIEIFLAAENYKLYTDKDAQKQLFRQMVPSMRFVEELFRSKGIPYLLDYTPSGCHLLFQNIMGTRATEELRKIGFVEDDLIKACNYIDPHDIRRWYGISLDAAHVFSGLGKLAECIGLLAMKTFQGNEAAGLLIEAPDIDFVLDCMWDLEKAADHARRFSGFIPCSNETLIDFIAEYKASDLFLFHRDFDGQEDIPRGLALEYAKKRGTHPGLDKKYSPFPQSFGAPAENAYWVCLRFSGLCSLETETYRQHSPRHVSKSVIQLDPGFFQVPRRRKSKFLGKDLQRCCTLENRQTPGAVTGNPVNQRKKVLQEHILKDFFLYHPNYGDSPAY